MFGQLLEFYIMHIALFTSKQVVRSMISNFCLWLQFSKFLVLFHRIDLLFRTSADNFYVHLFTLQIEKDLAALWICTAFCDNTTLPSGVLGKFLFATTER